MNGFTKKKVGTLTLGEKLKKLREERRVSLGEVSRCSRIKVEYLEYLEEGNYEKLPADVYVKGFLRSYAEFLGADEEALIKFYEKEKGIKRNIRGSVDEGRDNVKAINISSFVLTPKKIFSVLGVIIILSGFLYLYRQVNSFASNPRLVVISPRDNSEVDGNSVVLEGVTEKEANLFINDQPILVNDEGKFREEITLQSGVNVISVKSVNKFEKEAIESVTVNSKYQAADSPQDSSPDPENKDGLENAGNENNEVQIEVRVDPGPVWLSIESDDNLVFSGTMLTGATQIFKARERIVVNSGRANATFVKFNGKDIGALSQEAGAVRGVVFNKDTKY
ncbi:MAG: hypothetical protein A2288_01765 [Candidatus Moranbacteria bacterium RIFOXYA12_FULL_44_15]|nr:MAG: hypothetical protein A2288_01765 [Candidatus Moranbacteria bacterium RIFOXYA12_FULL_44_15]OGI34259.1 MAG: hypothetical protein A2259_04285 [Candidatus Moranbacteria bacterium RIFOXYA2_FULL_43_15]